MLENEAEKLVVFIDAAIKEICGHRHPADTKVMDIGCHKGELVNLLLPYGYDAYGCDFSSRLDENLKNSPLSKRLLPVNTDPYRLPFEDNQFDVITSTSVLEHVEDKDSFFREIYRVLKKGGYAVHSYPSKYYLSWEPHTFVPLANLFWPKCPRWWLALCAFLRFGVAAKYAHWKEAVHHYERYYGNEVFYWPNRKYYKLSEEIFGNYSTDMLFYINNSYGGYASLCRKLPFKKLTGWLSSTIRHNLLIQRKT